MATPNKDQLRAWRQLGRDLDADQMDAIFHMIDAFTEEVDSDEDSDSDLSESEDSDPFIDERSSNHGNQEIDDNTGLNVIEFPS